MAKQLPYEKFGITFQNSYWRASRFEIDANNLIATFYFTGYATPEARQAQEDPIGEKKVTVQGGNFTALYALHMRGGFNLARCAYKAANDAGIFPSNAQDV